MESNKNSFETVKENLCAVLDVVNEDNTQMKQQVAILVEENKGLRQEIGNLIEKVDILVSLVEELKNNSKSFIAQEPINKEEEKIENEPDDEFKELQEDDFDKIENYIAEEVDKEDEENEYIEEEEKYIEEDKEVLEEVVEEYIGEDEPIKDDKEEGDEEDDDEEEEEEEEEEDDDDDEEEERSADAEIINVVAEEEIVPSEFAEETEVNYREEEEIAFELDLQEMESEEPESVQVVSEAEPIQKILHEASKPDWYDWEVDYPAPYVEDILDGIGFNDKILFIRELFNEDDELFAATIEKLNSFEIFKGAVEYLRANFQDWNEEGDVVYRFYMSVRRKLRK